MIVIEFTDLQCRYCARFALETWPGPARGGASTPTFVIGRVVDGEFHGEVLSGAQPFEARGSTRSFQANPRSRNPGTLWNS